MTSRQIDDAATRIHELGVESAQCLAVAAVAAGVSLAATQVHPAFAVPLLVGAGAVGFLGVRAFVRRSFLIEDLAADPDAYSIAAVRRHLQGLEAKKPEPAATWPPAPGEDATRPAPLGLRQP
jgi:threonine/homoserine/homoserine lactone efflux protein